MVILFACLFDWLNFSPVEIKKSNANYFKTCLGWCEYQHGPMHDPHKQTLIAIARTPVLTRAKILGTLCGNLPFLTNSWGRKSEIQKYRPHSIPGVGKVRPNLF